MSMINELEKLLAEERNLLLTGDYDGLEALVARKAELGQRLAAKSPDLPIEAYQKLARKAAHNDTLLDAARRGLQATMTQLKQFADGEVQKTYSKEGERQSMSRERASVVQKI